MSLSSFVEKRERRRRISGLLEFSLNRQQTVSAYSVDYTLHASALIPATTLQCNHSSSVPIILLEGFGSMKGSPPPRSRVCTRNIAPQ